MTKSRDRAASPARQLARYPARRAVVSAAFTLSWDGRILSDSPSASPGPDLFRKLAAAGLIGELRITWRPRIAGGKSHLPITGFNPRFLPRGIALDLLKLQRKPAGYLATYRVRRTRR